MPSPPELSQRPGISQPAGHLHRFLAQRGPALHRGLATQRARQPGQKETRWAHLLGDGPDDRAAVAPPSGGMTSVAPAGLEARVAELEQRVAALEALLTDPDHTTEETSPT